jgi:pimeloyl-ACP methyl ester carboxylesterase
MLEHVPCAYQPAVWWLRKIVEISYNATWIPQKVPTLIIGGEFDGITPFEVFKNDTRFDRANIEKAFIKNAGHFPYVEQPDIIKSLFKEFEAGLIVQ